MTKHFADEDWTDFARDGAGTGPRARMQRHLDRGCPDCSRAERVWSAVRRLSRQDRSYEPPADAVRQVKGWFAIHRPARPVSRVARAVAFLYDSARGAQPAGVRAARTSSTRQLLYRVGTRLIKLSLETAVDAGRVSLIGQVVEETDATPVEVVPVRVVSGGTVLTAAVTNGLGEFEMEFEPARDLSLSLSLPDVRPFPVRVSLDAGASPPEPKGRTPGRRPVAPRRRAASHHS